MPFDYRTEYQRYRQYYVNLRRFYQRPAIKVSVFVLLSFGTVMFFSMFAIRPTVTTIGQLVREIEDKRNINERLGDKLGALDTLQGVMISVRDDVELILAALPEDSNLGRLMQELEYLAVREQVALLSVQFQPVSVGQTTENEAGKTQIVDFSLSLGGEFDNINKFLQAVEKVDRILVISEVELISGAAKLKQQGFLVIADIDGQAFFLKPEGGGENEEI